MALTGQGIELTLVALRRVPYSDSRAMLTAYSRELGRVSLLVAEGGGKAAVQQRALLMPGRVARCMATLRPGSQVMPARSFCALPGSTAMPLSPPKALTAMFLTEVLEAVLREAMKPDEPMFSLIADSFALLARLPEERIANFHLVFLSRLAALLGVEPDASTWREGSSFDMRSGVFTATRPLHPDTLDSACARLARTLGRLNYDTMHRLRLTRNERNAALDAMLRYLAMHSGADRLAGSLKTLAVARDVL